MADKGEAFKETGGTERGVPLSTREKYSRSRKLHLTNTNVARGRDRTCKTWATR